MDESNPSRPGSGLGGPARYHGALVVRPALGEGRTPGAADIGRALVLVRSGTLLWLAVALLWGLWRG